MSPLLNTYFKNNIYEPHWVQVFGDCTLFNTKLALLTHNQNKRYNAITRYVYMKLRDINLKGHVENQLRSFDIMDKQQSSLQCNINSLNTALNPLITCLLLLSAFSLLFFNFRFHMNTIITTITTTVTNTGTTIFSCVQSTPVMHKIKINQD